LKTLRERRLVIIKRQVCLQDMLAELEKDDTELKKDIETTKYFISLSKTKQQEESDD
jgi:hypothetical protein